MKGAVVPELDAPQLLLDRREGSQDFTGRML
jgi:hypothetical protein